MMQNPDAAGTARHAAGWSPAMPEYGIPIITETDGTIGVGARIQDARYENTAYPAALASAASWNTSLLEELGRSVGRDARDSGFNILLSGGTNLTRDPRGGRNFEYLGEDPLLAGRLAGFYAKGAQSNHIVATIKHFAFNAYETGRTQYDVSIPRDAAMESDLLAFNIALRIGRPGAVMCAYNMVWGYYSCESKALLNDILRQQWHYPGYVMSDWGAVHNTKNSLAAGLNQESGAEFDTAIGLGGTGLLQDTPISTETQQRIAAATRDGALFRQAFYAPAQLDGNVSDDELRTLARPILYALLTNGADQPAEKRPVDRAAGYETALRAAQQGIVLLKNDKDALPLAKTIKSIAVIGGHADKGVISGGGSPTVLPFGGNAIPQKGTGIMSQPVWIPSPPLVFMRRLAPQAAISYTDEDDLKQAQSAARKADAVIIFIAQWSTEGRDRANLSLTEAQNRLIAAIARTNPHVTVVLETEGPVLMPWLDKVQAVIQAWYPGVAGGEAIAQILFGDINPSGHLPLSFPLSVDDLPRPSLPVAPPLTEGRPASFRVTYNEGADVGYRWFARTKKKLLFPFGYGLSYARFTYDHLTVKPDGTPIAKATVHNESDRDGCDVVQLYAEGQGIGKRLVGWQRVTIPAHQSQEVSIPVDLQTIARFSQGDNRWHVTPGSYQLRMAHSAADEGLKTAILLKDATFDGTENPSD
ncbi:glycoside hydrolase family 3 C-terminal domain-containing protein [Asaia prunellae]|uniref:glycoside hydrolase family 3 C-terminal domain-containing protein n=1 Tax=Asaia prunellae TaxID=610245 RepID=UPI0006882CDE|nr:glycoside hydrolase family 3 C-terminal domain-containing protein [Asaia prunellae]